MKKILFFSLLAGMALAGCTNDELVNGSAVGGGNDYIRFTYNSSNMTRAEKLQNTHYEFGVFAKNDNGQVMNNYLVAYGESDLYQAALKNGSTTYGDPTSQVDGLSYWFYETLGKTTEGGAYGHTDYNIPDNDQVLKFWDKSSENYDFYAYAPYTSTAGYALHNALMVSNNYTEDFCFEGLSTFYTTPVTQIATANTAYAGTKTFASDEYNAEMVNYNEGLYAHTQYNKVKYGTDVPFTFNHLNAKINLKFYSEVKGYDVEIIDAVPTTLPGTGTLSPVAARGIQLSPATTWQSLTPMTTVQPAVSVLPTYYEAARVTAKANGNAANITVGNGTEGLTNANLVFELPGTDIGTTSASATKSPTTLYVLPNVKANVTAPAVAEYITPAAQTEAWRTSWDKSTSQHVADSTGYTLHLSYKLKPKDGSTSISIYDARVFIPALNCQWVAGKAYTYIFKLTKNSNGTTDPKGEGDPATPGEPYVDVTDPRVNQDPALQPIVFDGVEVVDYDAVDVTPEFPITENSLEWSLESAMKNIIKTYSNGGSTGAAIYSSKSGTGADDTHPIILPFETKTSDYIAYTGDVNNNNAFKDIQAFSQALYNEPGIASIEYNGTTYTRTAVSASTPPSWYPEGGSLSLEAAIATAIAGTAGFPYNAFTAETADLKLNSATPAPNTDLPLYVQLSITNTNDENVDQTAVKKAVANINLLSNNGAPATYATATNTVTINALATDFQWPEYPSMSDDINVNINNVYKDLNNFLELLYNYGVETISYSSTDYDKANFNTTSKEWKNGAKVLTSEIAKVVYATVKAADFAAGTYTATITVGLTDITLKVKI